MIAFLALLTLSLTSEVVAPPYVPMAVPIDTAVSLCLYEAGGAAPGLLRPR